MWTPENTNTDYPRTFNKDEEYWKSQKNTFWVRKSDFVRLKYIELGYSLPGKITSMVRSQGIRFYVCGVNLFKTDKVNIFDPESNGSMYSYPLMKTISVGLKLSF